MKKGENKMTITKDMTMGDILAIDMNKMAGILIESGMHCVGCPSHAFESLGEAAAVHGIDVDDLLAKLNAAIAE